MLFPETEKFNMLDLTQHYPVEIHFLYKSTHNVLHGNFAVETQTERNGGYKPDYLLLLLPVC